MELVDEIADDTRSTKEIMEASIVLFAYIINNESELGRYYRWLLDEAGVFEEHVPPFGEYKVHLETTLHCLERDYAELTGLLEEAAGYTGPESACLTSAVAPGPSAPSPRGEGRHRIRTRVLTGRRDGTFDF